jgi:monovalent cation/hydrogen antiporter
MLQLDQGDPLDPGLLSENAAWSRMAQAQLAAVVTASHQPDGTERHPRLLEQYTYRSRISASYAAERDLHRPQEIEHFTVVLDAIKAGRAEVLRMHRAGSIHDRVLVALEKELDLQEMTAELARD